MPFSNYQTSIHQADFEDIAAGFQEIILEYTVPADYVLHVINTMVTCERPGINLVYCFLEGVGTRTAYFDTNFIFPPTDSGDLIIDEGKFIRISGENNDSETVRFWADFTGYLEAKT